VSYETTELMFCLGAPARLSLPPNNPCEVQVPEIDSSERVAAAAKHPIRDFLTASIRYMSPDFDLQNADLVVSPRGVTDNIVASKPFLVIAFKGRPLVLRYFSKYLMSGEPARRGIVVNDDERRSRAFEGPMQRHEYGIPPGSRHYRAELQQFGDLSLLVRSEGTTPSYIHSFDDFLLYEMTISSLV
jgi:hypothetical protein